MYVWCGVYAGVSTPACGGHHLLTQGLGLSLSPQRTVFWLGWLTLELQGRPLSVPAEDTGSYNHFQLFTWVPGIRTQVLTFV